MKLSDLVAFLNYLDQHDLNNYHARSLVLFDQVAKSIIDSEFLDAETKQPVVDHINLVDQSLQSFQKSVIELKQKIAHKIVSMESSYFVNSSRLFAQEMRKEPAGYIGGRRASISPTAAAVFEQRLKIYTNWQDPGLIFRPLHLDCLENLVSLDPLYLVDTHQELLTAATSSFQEDYRRRVRPYVIDEYSEFGMLDLLPKNQFGLITAQGFFHFKPIEVVNKFITEVFELLKPGGAFVFTYNNCDYAGAVALAENHFACYTPGRLIKQHAASLGYVVNFEHNEINSGGVLELIKPGSRPSIRGGQTLAVIMDAVEVDVTQFDKKSKKTKTPKTLDSSVTKYYTDDERERIQLSAVVAGIDTKDNVANNYTIEKLEQLVEQRLNTRDFDMVKFQKRLDKLINKGNTK